MSGRTKTWLLALFVVLTAVVAFTGPVVGGDTSTTVVTQTTPAIVKTVEAPSDVTSNLKTEGPVPAVVEQRNEQLGDSLKPRPVGGAQSYSCRHDFSGHVYSSRNGIKPSEFVWHWTASPNRPGWGDVLGIQAYFKSTHAASATYIIDFEGHCLQMVPFDQKPWTQLAFNPTSVSVEVIATGSEPTSVWMNSPLVKKGILADLTRDNLRRLGAPLRWVDPVGCNAPAGITDHNHLECGNDHTDVAPYGPPRGFPLNYIIRQVKAGANADVAPKLERIRCRKINYYRKHYKSLRQSQREQAKRLRVRMSHDGWKCSTSRGAVRK